MRDDTLPCPPIVSGKSRVGLPEAKRFLELASTLSFAPKRSSASTSPAEIMRDDEIARIGIFQLVILGIAAAVALSLPVLPGDPTAKYLFAGLMVVYAGVLLSTTWIITRDPSRYVDRVLFRPGICGVIAGYAGVYYFGIFSPAVLVIGMTVYCNSLVGSLRYTSVVYAACALAQGALAVLIISGQVEDRGLFPSWSGRLDVQVITQLLVQVVLAATFVVARLSRKATFESMAQLDRASRALAERDALLREARLELEQVRRVGDPGRFTGQQLGAYDLGIVLGRGGMGEVYEARVRATGEAAAVKLLHRHLLDSHNVQRLVREARAAAALRSPHVVRVLEVGNPKSELPYIAMERLRGCDLASHLDEKRRLERAEVVELVRQVAAGLTAAAEHGVVHRDIKPHNVFLTRGAEGEPVWKILDFGLSKLAGDLTSLTHGRVLGTPGYMAPEQAGGLPVDARADTYSLAVIAYRALTGRPAFDGSDVMETLTTVMHRMPARPGDVAELSGEIDAVLAVGLAKDPEQRFQTASEFADALAFAVAGRGDAVVRGRAAAVLAQWPWASAVQ